MRQAVAIYHAPAGDSEVVHFCGVRFIDGETIELNSNDHPHLMTKIEGHHCFEVEMGEEVPDEPKPRRCRPPKQPEAVA